MLVLAPLPAKGLAWQELGTQYRQVVAEHPGVSAMSPMWAVVNGRHELGCCLCSRTASKTTACLWRVQVHAPAWRPAHLQVFFSICGHDMDPSSPQLYMAGGLHPLPAGMQRVLTCVSPLVNRLIQRSQAAEGAAASQPLPASR